MGVTKTYSSNKSDFFSEIIHDVNYFDTNRNRLVTSPAAVAALDSALVISTKWLADVKVSSKYEFMTTGDMDAEKGYMKTILSDIPSSILTDADCEALDVTAEKSDSYSQAPVPTTVPIVTVLSQRHLYIDVKVIDPSAPNKRGKPE
jgi:hypothetical protein